MMQGRCQKSNPAEHEAQVVVDRTFQTVLANSASSRSVTIALQFWDFLISVWESDLKTLSAPGGRINRV
jgi:hypothetical protein